MKDFYDEHRTPPRGLCLFYTILILAWMVFLVWSSIKLFS